MASEKAASVSGSGAAGGAGGTEAARKKPRPAPKAPVLSFDADEGEDAE
jgi:hypothetical protein